MGGQIIRTVVGISPANGFGNTECVITIDEALKNEVREAEIRFIPKGQAPKVITVTQLGYGKMIHVKRQKLTSKLQTCMRSVILKQSLLPMFLSRLPTNGSPRPKRV